MAVSGLSGMASSFAQAHSYAATARSYEAQAADRARLAKYEQWRRLVMQRQAVGTQLATYGALGLEVEDTAIDNLAAAVKEMALDRAMAARTARAEVFGMKQAAVDARAAASAAKKSGFFSAVSAGIGVAGLVVSDARLKEAIRPVSGALAKVRELCAYRYHYRGDDVTRIGLLAQEIERVLPEAVALRHGVKMVNLYAIQALIVAAIKELKVI